MLNTVLFNKYTIDLGLVLRPFIYVFAGFVIYEVIRKIMTNAENKNKNKKDHHQKRVKTINKLLLNIIKYLIIFFIVIAILSNFGINVKSILAGIGITAAIIGLAFQDIAKDFLSGIFIIIEDQFEIGDTVKINDFTGEVVSLGLKTTKIKDFKGATKIIANHTILELINYNLYNNLAIVDVSIGYEEDLEIVEKIIKEKAEQISSRIPNSLGELKILGVNDLEESGVIYRIAIEVKAAKCFEAERVLRREIKNTLTQANIKIPYKQIEVHNGNK